MSQLKVHRFSMIDKDIDLFEGQYPVENGVTYNTTILENEQLVLLDTVDARMCDAWMAKILRFLDGRRPDALVISHMEPDHSGSLKALCALYPEMKLVGNAKTFGMVDAFTAEAPLSNPRVTVKDGETFAFGDATLKFVFAPMVHWPEVMLCYQPETKTLFAADAFGRFGSANAEDPWTEEGRRYYTNIVGKYGAQVKAVLAKAKGLEIETVCPLHGPDLCGEQLGKVLALYEKWASYTPEDNGTLVAYAGFHGHTKEAAELMAKTLIALGNEVTLIDLARTNKSYAVAAAFRHKNMVLAATTYDGAYMPAMEQFLIAIKAKNLQGRNVGLIENGSWAPMAGKHMRAVLETMKGMEILPQTVTIRSAMNAANREEIAHMAEALVR
ncbi:MAG: FprA family A-type flavoprotein [Clostridia bacterium]|nr:FprA family A-type flavoprotein [Clostridia bacterium]